MTLEDAREVLRTNLSEYVHAKTSKDRNVLSDSFAITRASFRRTYGEDEWRRSFAWAVEQGGLEPYIFDMDVLRDAECETQKRCVILESPFRELDGEDPVMSRKANARYRQACIRDSLKRGEAPFASHQMYTEALDDAALAERTLGMTAGFAWHAQADAMVVYMDRGVSSGMERGMENASRLRLPIERRWLGMVDVGELFLGGRVDEHGFHPVVTPEYRSAYPREAVERAAEKSIQNDPQPPVPRSSTFAMPTIGPDAFRPDRVPVPAALMEELGQPKTMTELVEKLTEKAQGKPPEGLSPEGLAVYWASRAKAAEDELRRLGHGSEVIDVITDQGVWFTSHVGDASWDTAELRARRREHHAKMRAKAAELELACLQRSPILVGGHWFDSGHVPRDVFVRERDAMRDQLDFIIGRYLAAKGLTLPSEVMVLDLMEWLLQQ